MEKYSNEDIEKLISSNDFEIPNLLNKIKSTPIIDDEPKRINSFIPKLAFSLFTLLSLGSLSSISVVYAQEYEIISVDVNPSIELTINKFDRVIKVSYNNTEAITEFKNLNLKFKNLDNAVYKCIDRLYEDRYIAAENDYNLVILSGYGIDNHNIDPNKLVDAGRFAYDKKPGPQPFHVFGNVMDKDEFIEARENDLSFGQMGMIEMINRLVPDKYDFDSLKNKSLNELKSMYFDELHDDHRPPWEEKDGF